MTPDHRCFVSINYCSEFDRMELINSRPSLESIHSKSADKQRKHTKKGGQPDELCSAVEGPLVTKSARVPSALSAGFLHETT